MNTSKAIWIAVGALTLTLVAGGGVALSAVDNDVRPQGDAGRETSALAVDVAEDGTRFVFDEAPILENEYPAYGNPFVTQGYIYPVGTLDGGNGVLSDGGPAFPDEVIGHWTCWGYFVGDGADTTEGAWVITTQVFEFDGVSPGENSIVTIGPETPAGAGPAVRAVAGGSGAHAHVSGEVTQVTLGHNVSEGVNARFEFQLIGAADRPAA